MAKAPIRIINLDTGCLAGEFTSVKEADNALKQGFNGMKNGHRYVISTIHKEYTASIQIVLEDSTATLLKKEAHDASAEVEQSGLTAGDVETPLAEIPEKNTKTVEHKKESDEVTEEVKEESDKEQTVKEEKREEKVNVLWKKSKETKDDLQSVEKESEEPPAEKKPTEDPLASASQIEEAMEDLNSQATEEEDELDKLEKELIF